MNEKVKTVKGTQCYFGERGISSCCRLRLERRRKSTDLCMTYDGYQGIGLQEATRRTPWCKCR
ncbi:MAG TPA: hypothetical protein VJN89_12065 [Candidatus Acidoferrum sp.]|nr:hypothetical protein [Candidatus Acidoferrum sp.]